MEATVNLIHHDMLHCLFYLRLFSCFYLLCALHDIRPHNKQTNKQTYIWWKHADIRFFLVSLSKIQFYLPEKHTQFCIWNHRIVDFENAFFMFDIMALFSCVYLCMGICLCMFRLLFLLVAASLYSHWNAGKFNYIFEMVCRLSNTMHHSAFNG